MLANKNITLLLCGLQNIIYYSIKIKERYKDII